MASKDDELSEGGSRIYRHTEGPKEGPIVAGNEQTVDAVSAHIEQHVGPIGMVWHEIVSPTIHVDIHHVPPGDGRDYHTLVTSGMSDLPMQVPEGHEDLAFAELVTLLPSEWPLSQESFQDERHYWPIRTLKVLARFPHEYSTWLGSGHTIPNGDPPEPYAEGIGLCCTLLAPPLTLPEDFFALQLADRRIEFLAIIPLYADEMALKLEEGTDALFDRLDEHGVTDVIDVNRKGVCAKKRWWSR